jgi:hypothetical protein
MRIIVAVKTNRGGTWIVPIVESLIRHGDDVLCIVADEDGHLERSLTDVGASTMRSAALGGSGPISAALAFPRLVRQVRRFDPAVINYHLYRTALVFRVVSLFVPKARRVHSVPGPLFLEQRLVRWIERVVARRDSLIICTSGATRCLYRQVGYPDARMATIAYPIDLGAWDGGEKGLGNRNRHLRCGDGRLFLCASPLGTRRPLSEGPRGRPRRVGRIPSSRR